MKLAVKAVIAFVVIAGWVGPAAAADDSWHHDVELTYPDRVLGDSLGVSVAIEGDLIVGGAHEAVHVFSHNPATGVWTHSQELMSGGSSVAIDGGVIVAGAPGDGVGGAVNVFARNPSTGGWEHVQELTDPNNMRGGALGRSVAIDGDVIVAGAPTPIRDQGAVHVFTRNPSTGTWSHQQELADPNGAFNDRFGGSVALDSDRIVVGASNDAGETFSRGAVHVFARNASTGIWEHVQELSEPNAADGDALGSSVAIEGNLIVAGAMADDGCGGGRCAVRGAVHVYTHNPATETWEHFQELIDPNAEDWDWLGDSVAIEGDVIAAGPYDDIGSRGFVEVFVLNPSTGMWEHNQELTDPDGIDDRWFGHSVAIEGDLLVAGTYADGAVQLFGNGRFVDDHDTPFKTDIAWLAAEGITKGCNPPTNDWFCPERNLTRGEMATFIARAAGLTQRLGNPFVDDNNSIYEPDIERLAAAGITKSCNPPDNDQFCPDAHVTRGEMAAILVRALGYTDTGDDNRFVDDNGSVFEIEIERLAMAGVTQGCNPPVNDQFCPDSFVTRGEIAAFLHRAFG